MTVPLSLHSRLRPSLTHGTLRLTGERRASGSEFLVKLEFLLFVVGELARAFDVFEALVDIDVTSCLVQEGAACIEASLDVRDHFVDSREVHDCLTELLAVL